MQSFMITLVYYYLGDESVMSKKYSHPIAQLLTYGDCREVGNSFDKWPNYLELGLTEEHIPQLIQMALDEELNWADSKSLEVWAPVHAWRTLAQLRAQAAIKPLLALLSLDDDNEWVGEELPYVYGMIGGEAIQPLAEYLADESHRFDPRLTVTSCLERIGKMQPDSRANCVSVLTQQLEKFSANDSELNGFLISSLVDLKALESLDSIKKAYEQECVDYTVLGDYEDAEILMGVRKTRSTEPDYPTLADKHPWMKQVIVNKKRQSSVVQQKSKVGRNAPCPCGSGKKYKKCCLVKFVA